MPKTYNTPHRNRTIKTRLTEAEHADFMERLTAYGMSQSEFIRQAITGATITPIITVSPINDEMLAAVGRLTGEYGKIGGNLNQIAHYLNEFGEPYSIDFNEDICIIGHSSSGDADISSKKPTMKIVPVFHGKTGGGYLTQFYPHLGPVTYLGITQDRDAEPGEN
ncbi:MAG: plasmid mobilization relaxosome protein MobC [Acutalibacter sp.]|nr:plasmid mobilization relaxosome protein MobC [Acutalibacter sp.]